MFTLQLQHTVGLLPKFAAFSSSEMDSSASPGGREHEQSFSIDQKNWCIMAKPGTAEHTTA